MFGKGYGMPSSHAQFAAFFAVSLSLWLLLRHVPDPRAAGSYTSFAERLLVSIAGCISASAVAGSRVYLNYHTPKQVMAGVGAGAAFAIAWFIFTTLLRRLGWIGWGLENPVSRFLRLRDLITTEDLADAGWERWEARRRKRQLMNESGRKNR